MTGIVDEWGRAEMALQSMTGFARSVADRDGAAIVWEVKSVNGKSLDARLRLPPGFERIEAPARQAIQKRFSRGNFQASLSIAKFGLQVQPVVNEAFLKDLAGLARRLEEQFGVGPATADGLLALRGVLELPETAEDEETRADTDSAILRALDTALDGLEQARFAEGAALGALLSSPSRCDRTADRPGRGRPFARAGDDPRANCRAGQAADGREFQSR